MKITVNNMESSMIESFTFERKRIEDTSGVLDIEFSNGSSYIYEDVSMFDIQYLILSTDSVVVEFI